MVVNKGACSRGGSRRLDTLTAERRREIAVNAANARWAAERQPRQLALGLIAKLRKIIPECGPGWQSHEQRLRQAVEWLESNVD